MKIPMNGTSFSFFTRFTTVPLFGACLALLLAAACQNSHTRGAGKYYRVIKVVDGDTFWIEDGRESRQKVRLIGVDAPETRRSSRKEVGPYGAEARSYLTKVLLDKDVLLDYDVDRKDRYGRTLAYVYLRDGTFVNAELVKQGYAMVMTVPPNVTYAEEFLRLQREARERERGLWKER